LNTNPTACTNIIDLGEVSGDTGSDVVSASPGRTEAWFKVRVGEYNLSSVYLSATIYLQSPSGMDYDLYVYSRASCNAGNIKSSLNGAGQLDSVTVTRCDNSWSWDDFDVWIEVRFYGNYLIDSCGTWSLWVQGNTVASCESW
jgi:hypothetical protein